MRNPGIIPAVTTPIDSPGAVDTPPQAHNLRIQQDAVAADEPYTSADVSGDFDSCFRRHRGRITAAGCRWP